MDDVSTLLTLTGDFKSITEHKSCKTFKGTILLVTLYLIIRICEPLLPS